MTGFEQKARLPFGTTWLRHLLRIRCRGQSLVEYALILSLVAVAGMATLMSLGNNTGALLSRMRNMLVGNQQATSPVSSTAPMSGPGQNPPPPGGGLFPPPANLPPPATETVCYSGSSWCIDMSGGLGPNPVNVTGANGMTQQVYAMSDILDQISTEAAQDPSVDSSLAQMITDLANKAHAVGDYDADLFALQPNSGVAYFQAADFMKAKQAVTDYLSAHPDALVPGVQQALTYATGEVTDHMAALIGKEPSATDNNENLVMQGTVKTAIDELTAAQTHADANQICQNGGQPPACIVPP
jgi:hypothetical protein